MDKELMVNQMPAQNKNFDFMHVSHISTKRAYDICHRLYASSTLTDVIVCKASAI